MADVTHSLSKADTWIGSYVILVDVDHDEVVLGPYHQVVCELELIGTTMRATMKDAVTKELIVGGYAGWWFHADHPYKQAFVRAAQQGDKR